MNTCATCGYPESMHPEGRCPLCACGETPEAHKPVVTKSGTPARGCACGCDVAPAMHAAAGTVCWFCTERLPHACRYATWAGSLCPGRRGETSGEWLVVRQATFKPPPPPETALWQERLARDTAARHAASDAAKAAHVPEPVLRPLIPARPPLVAAEVAAGQGRQAKGLGKKAIAAGWQVSAWYWQAGDGTEGSAVRLSRGPLRAVATWERKPGSGPIGCRRS
jgi:hypothetical protein